MKTKQLIGNFATAICGLVLVTAANAQVNERTFRYANANPVTHPVTIGAEKLAELIKEKSGGKMTLKVFANGVLGGDVQVLSAVQGGTVDMASMNSGILQSQVKEFAVVDFPFLFNDTKEVDAILDGTVGQLLAEKLPAKGLVHLAYFELGFRNLTNSKRPVTKADDIAGLKVRVIQSPIYIDTFNALGANAVPMPVTEVYNALEQKIVDAQENAISMTESSRYYEVQKYFSVSQHAYNPQTLMMSKKTWDKLSKDEQTILMAAAKEASVFQRKLTRDEADKSLANLKKTMEVSTLPSAEVAKIREKLKPVITKHSAIVGEDFVKQVYAEIDKVRK